MLKIKNDELSEVTIRVFLESETYGREFFDNYDSLDECVQAVARLVESAVKRTQQDDVLVRSASLSFHALNTSA